MMFLDDGSQYPDQTLTSTQKPVSNLDVAILCPVCGKSHIEQRMCRIATFQFTFMALSLGLALWILYRQRNGFLTHK